MKKTLILIPSLLLVGLIAGCQTNTSSSLPNVNDLTGIQNRTELLGFQAISCVSLLSPAPSQPLMRHGQENSQSQEIPVEKIDEYLALMDQLLAKGDPIQMTLEASENKDYTYKSKITLTSALFESAEYTMYYNAFAEVDDDDDDDDDEIDKSQFGHHSYGPKHFDSTSSTVDSSNTSSTTSDENSTSSSEDVTEPSNPSTSEDTIPEEQPNITLPEGDEIVYEGILLSKDITYTFRGETEKEEGEVEQSFKAFIDKDNFIKVKQEIEEDEMEYAYEIRENGNTSYFRLCTEIEDGEMHYAIKEKSENTFIHYSFKKFEEAGKTIILVKIKDGENRGHYRIEMSIDENGELVKTYKKLG